MVDAPLTLVLGGVRSGKSAVAESIAERAAEPVYVATAEILDDEMRARVARHRERRSSRWSTHEVPLDLAQAVREFSKPARAVLIDSLGVWLGNMLHANCELDCATRDLLESLAAARGPIIIVSDEVGLGGVAANALAREFADHLGALNQRLAAQAQSVYWVVAGIATLIKGRES